MAEADPAIPLPSQIPAPTGTSKPTPHPTSLASTITSLPRFTDIFLERLHNTLATPSGTDAILLLLCYGSKSLSSLLATASTASLQHHARRLVSLALAFPDGSGSRRVGVELMAVPATATGMAAKLMGLSDRLKALSGLLSDVRAFSRLWGLLGMYFWGKRLLSQAKTSASASSEEKAAAAKTSKKLETMVAWTQLSLCTTFQALENLAYLGSKNVLPISPTRQKDLFTWSSRFWALYVALDVGSLVRELTDRKAGRQQRRVQAMKAAAENMDPDAAGDVGRVVEQEETVWLGKWRVRFLRQCAWMPVTMHYSVDGGLISEGMVGVLGTVPGLLGIKEIWGA